MERRLTQVGRKVAPRNQNLRLTWRGSEWNLYSPQGVSTRKQGPPLLARTQNSDNRQEVLQEHVLIKSTVTLTGRTRQSWCDANSRVLGDLAASAFAVLEPRVTESPGRGRVDREALGGERHENEAEGSASPR